MVHLGALPGSPLYDAERGIDGIVESGPADLLALQAAGFDAVMFGNENDRPYELDVDVASTATMAYVIGRLRAESQGAVRRELLWDPKASVAARRRDRGRFRARDLHWRLRVRHGAVDARCRRGACATATGWGGGTSRLLFNVSAEFAYSLDRRSVADRARSAVFSSVPDADPVSGPSPARRPPWRTSKR